MGSKPSSKPDWTVGNPDFSTVTVEPTTAKKQEGWIPDERPPRETMNWLFFNIDEWIDYFEEQLDLVVAQGKIYDAFVGGGGTHADINELMADTNIANIKNVLIVSTLAITTPQVINQDGMDFKFKGGAGILDNGTNIGLQIDSNRVRIINGRFQNFSEPGNKAIQINGNNNHVVFGSFSNNDLAIDDQGTNNVLIGNLEEI
jgi:hypothetical protein